MRINSFGVDMKRDIWSSVDFDSTIKDYEFTRKAMSEIHRVVYSGDFEDMDADMIFSYLRGKMQLVSFNDYLKRYLYGKARINEPFYKVADSAYQKIIMDSFDESYTPYSFEPTTRRWNATVKGWLNAENVKRPTVFLLGFGLGMSLSDVSEFLTKVIKEEDINIYSPREVIFAYCYQNTLPYSFADQKLEWYQNLPESISISDGADDYDVKHCQTGKKTLSFEDEKALDSYLTALKQRSGPDQEQASYRIFDSLVERAKEKVKDIYREYEELGEKSGSVSTDITSADLEKIICCGIPTTKTGNLEKSSGSLLNRHFRQKRISRQRIDSLLQRKLQVDRFDLITLLFFIYSQEMQDDEPELRCMRYMDEINRLLDECHMSGLYPVNAYEAFILMCLLSDDPLPTYSDIWEMSYQ